MNRHLRFTLTLVIGLGLVACSTTQRGGSSHAGAGLVTHIEKNRTALAQALAEADRASATGLKTAADQEAYRKATEKAVMSWLALSDDKTRSAGIDAGGAGQSYRLQASWPQNLLFDELIPARTIKGTELKQHFTRDGVGVPMVAWWKYTDERRKSDPFLIQCGYVTSVTATLEFRNAGTGVRSAVLVLHDPRVSESVRLAGASRPLAADFSAMGEHVLAMKGSGTMSALGALVRSDENLDKVGLIALERPAKDRIPVIMVHGLMSKPKTWQNVFNELGADPAIQKRYQLYFFRYPTGVPVLYSAAKMREQMILLHKELERVGGNQNYAHQMVLIGHSMGGLVSKMQVQGSGDRIWVSLFGSTPDKLQLTKEDRAALGKYFEFKPNPYVSRVIFVATPHRGSPLAHEDATLGKLAKRLIKLPGRVLGNTFDVLQGQARRNPVLGKMLAKGVPTSVDNLSDKSQFVKTSMSLPLRPGLHVHSIIGNVKQKPLTDPECSDGFVPYQSSHLDGVESELVVPSGHSAHENPEAVAEMRRILLLHLKSL